MFYTKINQFGFAFSIHDVPANIASQFEVVRVNELPIVYILDPKMNVQELMQPFFEPFKMHSMFQIQGSDSPCHACQNRVKQIYEECNPCVFLSVTTAMFNVDEIEAWIQNQGYEYVKPKDFLSSIFMEESETSKYMFLDRKKLSTHFNLHLQEKNKVYFHVPLWQFDRKGNVKSRKLVQLRGKILENDIIYVHSHHTNLLPHSASRSHQQAKQEHEAYSRLTDFEFSQSLESFSSLPATFPSSYSQSKLIYSTIDTAPVMSLVFQNNYMTYVSDGIHLFLRYKRSDMDSIFNISEEYHSIEESYYFDEYYYYKKLGNRVDYIFYHNRGNVHFTKLTADHKKESIFTTLRDLRNHFPDAKTDFHLFDSELIGSGEINVGDTVRVIHPTHKHEALRNETGEVLEVGTTYTIGFCGNYFKAKFSFSEIFVI